MSRGLPYDSDARPRLRRRDHRADDRRGVRAVGARRARSRRSVRRLREQPRAVPARHAQASRRDEGHQRQERPGRSLQRREAVVGRRGGARRGLRLSQRAGDGARADRHHRLHDGLRYHRRGARHRARQVQEARRRRDDEDRQHDGPDGAQQARLHGRAGRRHRRSTSTSTRPSKARRTCSSAICRCSTAPSRPPTASARFTTWATSR